MFQELTDEELNFLTMHIYSAREAIYAATWPIGSKAIYSAMGMDMSLLMSELNGEQASRLWKDR